MPPCAALCRKGHGKAPLVPRLEVGELAVRCPGYGRIGQAVEASHLHRGGRQQRLLAAAACHRSGSQIRYHGPGPEDHPGPGIDKPRHDHARQGFGHGLCRVAGDRDRARCSELTEGVDVGGNTVPDRLDQNRCAFFREAQRRDDMVDVERKEQPLPEGDFGPRDGMTQAGDGPDGFRACRIMEVGGRRRAVAAGLRIDDEGCCAAGSRMNSCSGKFQVVHRVLSTEHKACRQAVDRVLFDENYEWLDNDALEKVLGTRHHHAAVRTPRTVLVNPAALYRGLGATLPANVEVCEESPVLRVRPGSPVRIECAEESVSAPNVLLTTNAFTARLGFLRRRVFPLIECASLSRPLTDVEQAAMGGVSDWGITGFATVRRTTSNRILVRHGTYYSSDFRVDEVMRRRLQTSHLKGVRRRYPALDNMTRNWSSHFGRIEPGIFVPMGYSGVGMPRGTAGPPPRRIRHGLRLRSHP